VAGDDGRLEYNLPPCMCSCFVFIQRTRMHGQTRRYLACRTRRPPCRGAMQARSKKRRYRRHQTPTVRLIPLLEQLVDWLLQPTSTAEPPPAPCETRDQAVQCNLLHPPPLPKPKLVQAVYPTSRGRGFALIHALRRWDILPPPGQLQHQQQPEPLVAQMQPMNTAQPNAHLLHPPQPQLLDLLPQPGLMEETWD
jgi:hypothetical protein